MRFSLGVAMCPPGQFTELARTAESCGFHAVALPDSIFYSERVSAAYPYTSDGSRFWGAETPWADPLVAAAAMGAVTERIRFCTQVLKLGPRNPVLLARQVASAATLTGDRFDLGVGLGWAPEEFEWCGAPYGDRGRRVDEAIEVLRLILGGGMVEHHGRYFDFDALRMSPAPGRPVPIYVGGHTEAALRRAARLGDGWTSAMMRFDELREAIGKLTSLRAEYGRADASYQIQAVCVDRFGLDGYRQQEEIGVTDAIVVPWVFDGVDVGSDVRPKRDSIARFADEIIARM